jgi:hypothetical protein
MFGFRNVTIVDEQATPDGNFPTVNYPNPEESDAMAIGLQKANVRTRLAANLSIEDLVPAAVARHIVMHHLYGAVDDLHGND